MAKIDNERVIRLAIDCIVNDCIRDLYNGFNKNSQLEVIAANNGFMYLACDVIGNNDLTDDMMIIVLESCKKVHETALSLLKSM